MGKAQAMFTKNVLSFQKVAFFAFLLNCKMKMTSLKQLFSYFSKINYVRKLMLILLFRVCNNKDPYEFTDAEINQFEILNVRTVDLDDDESNDEFNENDDVEEID